VSLLYFWLYLAPGEKRREEKRSGEWRMENGVKSEEKKKISVSVIKLSFLECLQEEEPELVIEEELRV